MNPARILTVGMATLIVAGGAALAAEPGAEEKGPVDSSTLPLAPAVNPKNTAPGLQVAYYVGGDLSSALNFDAAAPAKMGTVSVIDLAFAEAKENFGLKFTGYVHVPKDGEYTFFTNSDDGSRLFIGNMEVVNNDGMHAPKEVSGSIRLKAGKHPIRVYFMQGGGGGGGGGRIALVFDKAAQRKQPPVTVRFSADGGKGYDSVAGRDRGPGEPGTLFLSDADILKTLEIEKEKQPGH